jgi:hypothetical protein
MLSEGQRGWVLLMMLALMLIIIGFQGGLGKTVAILFCPKYIELDEGGGASGNF